MQFDIKLIEMRWLNWRYSLIDIFHLSPVNGFWQSLLLKAKSVLWKMDLAPFLVL